MTPETKNKKRCCKKCKEFFPTGTASEFKIVCVNSDCSCHSTPTEENQKGGERCKHDVMGYDCYICFPDKDKTPIYRTSEKEEERIAEAFKVIPSPRIDWCCECKTEHGYDCPKELPKEGWEEEFDDIFHKNWEEPKWNFESYNNLVEHVKKWQRLIKSFIEKEIRAAEQRGYERGLNKLKELGINHLEEVVLMKGNIKKGRQEERDSLLSHIEEIVSKLQVEKPNSKQEENVYDIKSTWLEEMKDTFLAKLKELKR